MASKNTKAVKSANKATKSRKVPKALRTEISQNNTKAFAFPTAEAVKAATKNLVKEVKADKLHHGDLVAHPTHGQGRYLGMLAFTDMKVGAVEFPNSEDKRLGTEVKIADLTLVKTADQVRKEQKTTKVEQTPGPATLWTQVALKEAPSYLLGRVIDVEFGKGEACDLIHVDVGDERPHYYNATSLIEFVRPVAKKKVKDDHPASVDGHAKWVAAQCAATVKFETLPLLAQFRTTDDGDRYLKVGNSTAIHIQFATALELGAWQLQVGKQGKQRFKKTQQVFRVTK